MVNSRMDLGPTVDDFLQGDISRIDRLRHSAIQRKAGVAGLALYAMVFLPGCAAVFDSSKPKQYILSERSIDTAFEEGEYLEGVVRMPYDFVRKTIIRGVTAPKTFLWDTPSAVVDDANERIKNSKTREDEIGHTAGSILFAIPLYVGKILENIGRYVIKNPIEAIIHGAAYGAIGAEISGGSSKRHAPAPSPAPGGGEGGGI